MAAPTRPWADLLFVRGPPPASGRHPQRPQGTNATSMPVSAPVALPTRIHADRCWAIVTARHRVATPDMLRTAESCDLCTLACASLA